MSKYPDINKAHAKLFGEGWHLENHPESIVKQINISIKNAGFS